MVVREAEVAERGGADVPAGPRVRALGAAREGLGAGRERGVAGGRAAGGGVAQEQAALALDARGVREGVQGGRQGGEAALLGEVLGVARVPQDHGAQEAQRLFVDQLTSTMEVIAKDVKLQVEWNDDAVYAYRLVGYENRDIADRDFRNDKVDAGEIGSGHRVTAVYEVIPEDDAAGLLARVRVRNKAPGPDSPAVERSYTIPTSVFNDHLDEAEAQTRIAFAATAFSEVLRGSPHVHELSLTTIASLARGAARIEYPEDRELVSLIEAASSLRGEGAVSRR